MDKRKVSFGVKELIDQIGRNPKPNEEKLLAEFYELEHDLLRAHEITLMQLMNIRDEMMVKISRVLADLSRSVGKPLKMGQVEPGLKMPKRGEPGIGEYPMSQ